LGGNSHDGYRRKQPRSRGATEQWSFRVTATAAGPGHAGLGGSGASAAGPGDAGLGGSGASAAGPGDAGLGGSGASAAGSGDAGLGGSAATIAGSGDAGFGGSAATTTGTRPCTSFTDQRDATFTGTGEACTTLTD
jgi:hypothetical protein